MNFTPSFPLGLPVSWSSPAQLSPSDAKLKNWLLDTRSLTERLQSHCRRFRVQVLGQEVLPVSAAEAELLALSEPRAWVREVILWGDEQPWVFARSLLPDALLQNAGRDLADLGERPLGQVIFNDSRFQRQPIEVAKVAGDAFGHNNFLWGRRSLFHMQQQRLMVAEVFLPAAPAYSGYVG